MELCDKSYFDGLPLVMSVPELATILHIGKNSAYQLVSSGQIRCIRIGKNIRIPRSALLEYLDHIETPS